MKINKLIDFNKLANLAKIINKFYGALGFIKRKKMETSCISLILIVIAQFVGSNFFSTPELPIFKSNNYSLANKIEELKKSHLYFTKIATDKEKLVRWIDMFYRCNYSKWRNFGSYDCSSAMVAYLQSWGANISKDESVTSIKEKVERLIYLKQISLKKNFSSVQPWDLVIFKQNGAGNYHIGIVYDRRSNGLICYADVNGRVDSMGFDVMQYNDARIDMIVNISFAFWAGDLLNEEIQ